MLGKEETEKVVIWYSFLCSVFVLSLIHCLKCRYFPFKIAFPYVQGSFLSLLIVFRYEVYSYNFLNICNSLTFPYLRNYKSCKEIAEPVDRIHILLVATVLHQCCRRRWWSSSYTKTSLVFFRWKWNWLFEIIFRNNEVWISSPFLTFMQIFSTLHRCTERKSNADIFA